MKSLLFIISILLISAIADAQIRLGIKAGTINSKQVVGSNNGTFFSNNHYRNIQAGLVGELQVSEKFSIQSQLLYARKGSTLLSTNGAAETMVKINYIEVPVYLMYKLPVGFGKAFGGAGAGVSYGFGGKLQQGSHSTNVFANNTGWKRTDLSLNFTAGVEFNNGLFVSISTQKGMRDIYRGDNTSVKNRSVALSVGFMLN